MSFDPPAQTTRLSIEICTGREPIQGRMLDVDGAAHPFRGWLELTAALEAARAPRPSLTDPEEEQPR